MSLNTYQQKNQFTQFGNLLIILGVIPIATFVLAFIVVYLGFTGFFVQVINDVILVIILIILLVNNKSIKEMVRTTDFSAYYALIAFYSICTVVANVFYYITYFLVYDAFNWLICVVVYQILILFATIAELIAWIRLRNYAITVIPPLGINIKKGVIILAIAAGLSIGLILIDLSYLIVDTELQYVLIIIVGLASAVLYIIGYFKAGSNIKRIPILTSSTEPVLDFKPAVYGALNPTINERPSSSGSEVKFCIKCGTNLVPDGEFCPRCGWKVEKFN